MLQAVVDLPFAVSPVIVGVALILLLGQRRLARRRAAGDLLAARDGAGDDVRDAAVRGARGRAGAARDRHRAGGGRRDARRLEAGRRSGASRCPRSAVGVAYGVVLTVARSLGEFGALTVVAGGVPGESQTLTLLVHARYIDDHNAFGAYSASTVLMGLALLTLDPDDHAAEEASMITVSHVTKRFGDFVALDDVSLEVPDGSLTALLGPSRLGQVDAAADHRRARVRRLGHGRRSTARTSPASPPQKRGIGFVFQHYAAFKHMTVRDNVGVRPEDPQDAEGPDRGARRRAADDRRARRLRQALPVAALRRPAPADGARPRAGGRAAGAAARRAVRRAGREGPRRAARVAAAPARRGPRDDAAGHPRPGGGDVDRRQHRGHGQRPHRAGRRSARALRPPREPVRDGLPRPGRALDGTLVRPHDIAIDTDPDARRPRGAGARASATSASRSASSSCCPRASRCSPSSPAPRPRSSTSRRATSCGCGPPAARRWRPRRFGQECLIVLG